MALEKFHYSFGTKKVTLPLFDALPFGVIRKLRKQSEQEQFFALLEEVADEKSLAVIDTMTSGDVADMMTEWQSAAGIKADEPEES